MWFFKISVTYLLGRKYQIDVELVLPKHGILSWVDGLRDESISYHID